MEGKDASAIWTSPCFDLVGWDLVFLDLDWQLMFRLCVGVCEMDTFWGMINSRGGKYHGAEIRCDKSIMHT